MPLAHSFPVCDHGTVVGSAADDCSSEIVWLVS